MSQFSSDDAQIIDQLDAQAAPSGNSNLLGGIIACVAGALTLGALVLMMVKSNAPASAPAVAQAPVGVPITWYWRFDQAQEIARGAKKPILINFYTDWCPACKHMDAGTLQSPWIQDAAKDVVALKINAEREPQLAKRYNVKVYPTFVWVDAEGQERGRLNGGGTVREFWDEMQKYR